MFLVKANKLIFKYSFISSKDTFIQFKPKDLNIFLSSDPQVFKLNDINSIKKVNDLLFFSIKSKFGNLSFARLLQGKECYFFISLYELYDILKGFEIDEKNLFLYLNQKLIKYFQSLSSN